MTKIEWADMTINPVVGCSKCSPGCDNCYAERFAARLAKNPKTAAKYARVVDENGKWTGKTSHLDLRCFSGLPRNPKRIFVGSMTDMFHPALDDDEGQGWRGILRAIHEYPQHEFLFLTKRPERAAKDLEWLIDQDGDLPPNLWLGVTVCNQQEADEKIPILLRTPAAKRFVSVEPMLGSVDLIGTGDTFPEYCPSCADYHDESPVCPKCGGIIAPHCFIAGLDWVICGGETGPGARPMHPDWVRSLRDQCEGAGVPFFFKSWGEWAPDAVSGRMRVVDGKSMYRVGKTRAGRLLDGREWNEVPV